MRDGADHHRDRKCKETEDTRDRDFKIRQGLQNKTKQYTKTLDHDKLLLKST